MNIYNFFNPRITSAELDELDMSDGSNGNEVTINFTYDGLYIDTAYDILSDSGKLKDLTHMGLYPLGGPLMQGFEQPTNGTVDNGITPTSQMRKSGMGGMGNTMANDTEVVKGNTIPNSPKKPEGFLQKLGDQVSDTFDEVGTRISNAFDDAVDFAGSIFR